mgnify:CR=1 FL=1
MVVLLPILKLSSHFYNFDAFQKVRLFLVLSCVSIFYVLFPFLKFCSQFWSFVPNFDVFFNSGSFICSQFEVLPPPVTVLIPILKFCYQFWSFVPNSNKKICFIDVHFAKRAVWKSGTNEVTWEGEGRGAGQAWEDLPLLFSV